MMTLALYVVSLLMAIGILATITLIFKQNMKDMNSITTDIQEFDRFNLYFLQDVKNKNNKLEYVTPTEVMFSNGNLYIYYEGNESIHLINDEINLQLSMNVSYCGFEIIDNIDKQIIMVDIIIGNETRNIEYVLGQEYTYVDNENNYINNNSATRIVDMFDETGLVLGKVHVGDYVLYSPDTEESYLVDGAKSTSSPGNSTANQTHTKESLQWRVLDIKGDQIRLISATSTSFSLTLQGANGYNNAVKLIDEICSIYGGSKGNAQGLKIEDIQEYMNEKNYKNINASYGNTYTPSSKNYPLIFAQENKQLGNGPSGHLGLSEQDGWYDGTTTAGTLNTTYTYWDKSMVPGDWTNIKYHEIFINNGSNYSIYWLSSRCVFAGASFASFSVRFVGGGLIHADDLSGSGGSAASNAFRVRPVVTLNSDVKVIGGNGIKGWKIE